MMTKKLACLASTALVGWMLSATGAFAQSTGTETVESVSAVTVTAASAPNLISPEQVAKSRSTIGQEYIATQQAGQTILQTLNLAPGVVFVNNDPYGSSGGNIRIHGFDNNRISLTFDGVPLNDTGNYAIYSNQQLDPELITRASVSTTSTDVDSPTASATGGTVNYSTVRPSETMGFIFAPSVGSFNYRRLFAQVDTGAVGPWGTTMFAAASYQKYDKFKGPGDLEKKQYNARILQNLGDNGDFISMALNYNENRNNFYRNLTKAQFAATPDLENSATCVRPAAAAGTVQNEGAGASADCTNYYNLRVNPSNTGSVRFQSKFHLADNLILTVDPSFQYVLANGGGTTVLSEKSRQLLGNSGLTGIDLNGDGDTLDSIRFYTPNTTNTRRYGVISSLIWNLNDNNRLRVAYTYDKGNHRQTGEWAPLDASGNPDDVFGGKDGYGKKVIGAGGFWVRQRDRASVATLNQFSIDYNGRFYDDQVRVNIGLRAPYFERDLNQFCYTQTNGFAYCSTQVSTPTTRPAGITTGEYVTLAGESGTTKYLAPYHATVKYDALLPNVGVTWRPGNGRSVIFGSYSEGLSAPRTDNLYSFTIPNLQPETTKSLEGGYRFQGATIQSSTSIWASEFDHRIVTSYDPETTLSIDREVGKVKLWGVDSQVMFQPADDFRVYAKASYNHSELQSNIVFGKDIAGNPVALPTKGKQLVETPTWNFGGRVEYVLPAGFTFGVQANYVGERYSTDVNDEKVPSFMLIDANLRYDMDVLGLKDTYLQLNATNLFDKSYLGNISSKFNANTVTVNGVSSNGSSPTYSLGAPQTLVLSLHAKF